MLQSNRNYQFRSLLIKDIKKLINDLSSKGQKITKSVSCSKERYDLYDDRDMRDEIENRAEPVLVDGEVTQLGAKDRRLNHLEYLFTEIDELLLCQEQVSIIEIGCGNLLNAVEVNKRYGERVIFKGMEISESRVRIGLDYFSQLNKSDFSVGSITERTEFTDGEFDIVFSMHCLEQIAYETDRAVQEMGRICRHKLVMIEPVFENGNFLQRVYLMLSDHTRILLGCVQDLGFVIEKNISCPVQTNLENQSTLLVAKKPSLDGCLTENACSYSR